MPESRLRFRWAAGPMLFGTVLSTTAAFADTNADLINKGHYLVNAGDCVACHTKEGGQPFAGGRPVPTPFGTIISPNITPDKDTGIGKYTDDTFYRAMHEGIGDDSEYLYPVFPYTSYTKVSRDDVLAIKAYLFSLQPVHTEKTPNTLPFPYNVRSSLLVWRQLFFKPGEFQPDPAKSEQINRGAYLVQGLGHCGECHTQRNALGGSETSSALAGSSVQGWYAPNITSDWAKGIGSWSEDELFSYLKTGVSARKGVVAGPMSEVVHESLAYLSDDDVHAIAAYLKSTPPKTVDSGTLPDTFNVTAAGADIYVTNCASCHQLNGQGIDGKIPPLAGNGSVTATGPENIVRALLGGLPATNSYGPMPSFAHILDDQQIANVANYVRASFGNKAAANADALAVGALRKDTKTGECGTSLTPGQKAVFDAANANAEGTLTSVIEDTAASRINTLLGKIKSVIPDARPDDIVNGVAAAYCPYVMKDQSMSAASRRRLLDNFAQLFYTRAVGGNIAGGAPAGPTEKRASTQ